MNRISSALNFLVIIFCFIGVYTLQQKRLDAQNLDSFLDYAQIEANEKMMRSLQSKLPTFGFDNLVADGNYLQFIQYFGDNDARKATGYGLIPTFFEVVTQNDPNFIRAILMISTANTMYALNPTLTVKMLDKAAQSVDPTFDALAPYLWSYKGMDEMLFLGDVKSAQKSYEKAAEWALKTNAPDKEALAQRNRETAAFLAGNPNSRRARIAGWTFLLSNPIDQKTQELAIKQILALGGKVNLLPQGGIQVIFPEED